MDPPHVALIFHGRVKLIEPEHTFLHESDLKDEVALHSGGR